MLGNKDEKGNWWGEYRGKTGPGTVRTNVGKSRKWKNPPGPDYFGE